MINKSKIPSGWTEEKLRGLKEGLALVKRQNGFWPDEESLRLAHGCQSAWAAELVVTRRFADDSQILLALYSDGVEDFRGKWHIPGGYNRKSHPSVQATCSAVARRELGVDVRYTGVILGCHVWTPEEHPYGTPLSLYVQARLLAPVTETDKLRFFSFRELPELMVKPHRRFIQKILQ